jgi:ADP-ribosyl-[dinitrogen reductase] hydrolase
MPFVYNSAKGIIMSNKQDKLIGSFVGLAVGDAVGASVEFKPRGTFPLVTDMNGGGPFKLPVGVWTDDTIMAVCLAESLIEHPSLNKEDLLDRFSNWYLHGYNSPTGVCFDIGATTVRALENYIETGSLTNNPESYLAGNGSIMRLAPVAIAHHADPEVAAALAAVQSESTHASPLATGCSELLSDILTTLYNTDNKMDIYNIKVQEYWPAEVANILDTNLKNKNEKEIKSTGYTVHTLEAAVWCFLTTDNFEQAVLKATNLGDDTDTVAAVTGQIAGAYYGETGIPEHWIKKLYDYERIKRLSIELSKTSSTVSGH